MCNSELQLRIVNYLGLILFGTLMAIPAIGGETPRLEAVRLESGDIADAVNAEPPWPEEMVNRGYAVVPRPTLPLTYHTYMPRLEELNQPLSLTLAASETGSAVIFVRSLGEDITVRATIGALVSDNGYGLSNGYGASFFNLRAAEETKLRIDSQRYLMRPEFLLHTNQLTVQANDGGQFWLTVAVPDGVPPGEYTGEVIITPVGANEEKVATLPVVLTVRNLVLRPADVAFGTWYHTGPSSGSSDPLGPSDALPDSELIYLRDQRRHGMNTVAAHCMAERKDKEGNFHVAFAELDEMVANVKRAGLCRNHPLLLLTWREDGAGGEFGQLAGGTQAIMDIYRHGHETDWPEILFTVCDEPGGSGERFERVIEIMKDYTPARRQGVRTVTAEPDPTKLGHLYDVWIMDPYLSTWKRYLANTDSPTEIFALADKYGSEVWMYDCGLTGRNPLLERFYAGLWTWRMGVKGNMVWSYGWYVRINDQGLPESKLAWEGRLAGVNDYRYLHTLEQAIADAQTAGHGNDPAVKGAQDFLQRLESRIRLDTYDGRPTPPMNYTDVFLWNPVADMAPEDYDRIREECGQHIQAVRRAHRQ